MSQLLIPDLDEATLARLRERAVRHGRSVETEAKAILSEALPATSAAEWAMVNSLREQLVASGRLFADSTDLIREDRNR
jgi:plasmid stability protein